MLDVNTSYFCNFSVNFVLVVLAVNMSSEEQDIMRRKQISLRGLPEIDSVKDVITAFNRFNRNRPIRTSYLGHVTGYQPIRDQYFLIPSVPCNNYSI